MLTRQWQPLKAWLEDRIGIASLKRDLLEEPLPAKVGWAHVLGSAALFLFGLQGVSGILLAMNYSASPEHAHASVQFIMRQPLGKVVRGLHHYGASAMVVIVGLHLARVFLFGAYKKPREVTWMVGVLLLALVLGFAFTGYLLPYDQKAYWATQVGVNFAGYVPLIGPAIKRILLGGDQLGAPSLSRFFAIHTLLLPALFLPLVVAHIYLMRRKGEMPPGAEATEEAAVAKPQTFYPDQAFRDVTFAAALLCLLVGLTLTLGVPLEPAADPTSRYLPRPEWYFLPLFQLERLAIGDFYLFGGERVWIGTVLLPTLLLLFLFFLPLLDRNPSRRAGNRKFALSGAVLFALLVMGLGLKAKVDTDREKAALAKETPPSQFSGLAAVGERLFQTKCTECHSRSARGKRKSATYFRPLGKGERSPLARDELILFLANPQLTYPQSKMPPAQEQGLSLSDLEALAAYLERFQPARRK